ncbi:Fe(3+) ABC transporter substrate-binding protein [Amphiplicatus metriothermophilus]|uniref:Iron(III) transport system substrate-binding protein n=1 Tax=Amphiplicatus metriothermophilus TaxID=1519374 RepID=A0A239PKD8_9PROT|nr:Fe(3+) ABC transporter substrate-binding protein [Amphiplicatus metriothermophilus]MBB5517877.1 iron(III) transport system substrate-binding protein [Amphiplicatus metriothermophilus]SNT67789.1 iron(III) transport system substrate-binding protein [Amphiplicatus metriothermophilus]
MSNLLKSWPLGFVARALRGFLFAGALALLAACGPGAGAPAADDGMTSPSSADAGEVNVYSGRHYDSDVALFDAFTAETGIKVNLIEAGGDALIERLAREGGASPADIFMTADAGVLWRAEERGLFRPIADEAILARVPAQYRHPDGLWVGLSKRARIIIFNKDQGLPEGLDTYEDLADPAYRGMICVRSSTNVYNQSLLASLIAHHGPEAAEDWARGVVANFARKPQGNDTSQIEAVAAGLCRLAIVNSYYVARFIGSDDPARAAIGEKIGVLFPNQADRGAHVNISGAGVTRHAPNPENAERLIGFLLRDESQLAFAGGNNEYPVVEGVPVEGPIASFGAFRADSLNVSAYGRNQAEAVRIFDRVGWP